MNTERDKFLTEAMGECWHEPFLEVSNEYYCNDNISFKGCDADVKCSKCGKRLQWSYSCIDKQEAEKRGEAHLAWAQKEHWQNFSSWQGFGKLWVWAQKQSWWISFLVTVVIDPISGNNRWITMIDPDTFADAIYAYLRDNPK